MRAETTHVTEAFVMSEKSNVQFNRPAINSGSLLNYLRPNIKLRTIGDSDASEAQKSDFAPLLNLGHLKPHLLKLRSHSIPLADQLTENLTGELLRAEAAIVVFHDPFGDRDFDVSEMYSGYSTEIMRDDAQDLIDQKLAPLIIAHNHEKNMLPSAWDYTSLLKAGYEDGSREVRAIEVVCPDETYLVIASNKTPVMEPAEIEQFLDYWNGQLDFEDETQLKLRENIELIHNSNQTNWYVKMEEGIEGIRELVSQKSSQMLSQETDKILASELERVNALNNSGYQPETDPEYQMVLNEYFAYSEQVDHAKRLEMADSINVVIYRSTDDTQFQILENTHHQSEVAA